MSRPGSRAASLTRERTRPAGLSHGTGALLAAWVATGVIALLTGATAVVILLVVGLVAMAAGVLSGWWAVRGARVHSLSTSVLAVAGDPLTWQLQADAPHPVHLTVRMVADPAHEVVVAGWLTHGGSTMSGTAPRRGVYDEVEAVWSSAGRVGLVWWRRRRRFPIPQIAIAPRAAGDGAPIVLADDDLPGERAVGSQPGRDEIDGVRSWRDGDELTGVHWPSTMRTGEFVVRQRFRERDERWVVSASTGTQNPATEAARVRHSLERGLGAGAQVAVQVDRAEPVVLDDEEAVLRWCAAFDPHDPDPVAPPWWKKQLAVSPEPENTVSGRARWFLAGATAVAVLMVLQPLGYADGPIAFVLVAVAGAALVTGVQHKVSDSLRQLLGLVAGAGVGFALIDVHAIDSVGASLRYLLPQVLVSLIVMQGFECIDRRGARVTLACAAVLTAYAAGIRIDARLSAWLLAAIVAMGIAARQIGRVHRPRGTRQWRTGVTQTLALFTAAATALAILAVVPVPRGPAQLTLPSWFTDFRHVQNAGALAAPDGSPLLGGRSNSRTDGTSAGGTPSGYPGFSQSMDTALRGDLGDEVVLRVRAPYADFWRGQTFSNFDGRTWYVDDGSSEASGESTNGPDHLLKLADLDVPGKNGDELIQTFYVQVDMPNIVFAAYRPTRVLLNAPLWQRPDGALRADAVLPKGSAYTVVSQRSLATAPKLEAEGDIRNTPVSRKYLELPDTTTARTATLAREITAGTTTTYDAVLAIEAWLKTHVSYDLNAPVPPVGADAVDDFLFRSKRGFCEQIATATAIMLRSLGIPARIATGYVPSSRDDVAGVWISRASDAHAWVEVPFPGLGWIAFDPTADVPLSGDAVQHTIGTDLAKTLSTLVGDHIGIVLLLAFAGGLLMVSVRLVRRWWHRRRRGRWGLLQDRFLAEAVRRGAPPTAPNALLARAFDDPTDETFDVAVDLAAELDASAFSHTWVDDDEAYARALATLHDLTRAP